MNQESAAALTDKIRFKLTKIYDLDDLVRFFREFLTPDKLEALSEHPDFEQEFAKLEAEQPVAASELTPVTSRVRFFKPKIPAPAPQVVDLESGIELEAMAMNEGSSSEDSRDPLLQNQ